MVRIAQNRNTDIVRIPGTIPGLYQVSYDTRESRLHNREQNHFPQCHVVIRGQGTLRAGCVSMAQLNPPEERLIRHCRGLTLA